ncbi:protein of unknown function [Flavobacterium flevense]|uniref:Uncharacterized protein n=1 Tax=Flavobacterium flevense TaxID=983 RepID=A0A4Y4AU06_9FLAO|nr:DUF4153 domain-containing protein [Flavobacterium flevense]GEC71695.1 hypothetical protein FFL01_12340 [Flavobacterium flevense]SHL26899.1 protein of unknown function [Flavobacterium flevense]
MKKLSIILGSSLLFTLLFYNEDLGLNWAIFGLVQIGLICYLFKEKLVSRLHLVLVITSILSCFAFAWYADFPSFLAMALSVVFLQFKTQEPNLKLLQVFPLVIVNGLASLGRILMFSQYIPKRKVNSGFAKQLIAYFIIPAVFLGLFLMVYSFGSDHFSAIFTDYYLDIDAWQAFFLTALGFYISFTFWNYWIPEVCYQKNELLANDFNEEVKTENKNSFSFLDIDFERKSGEITLFLLNALLIVFIVTYNYEQFFEIVEKSKLSSDTHERVRAVIFSIIMAIGVILFYFKGGFNFDEKAQNLKKMAKMWIVLNAVLIVSTIIKNSEYVLYFGLTYKRLGVYAFLILAIIGLLISFIKISRQKTNAFLFNRMLWYFYGTILLCSFVNWGNLITRYNIAVDKGVEPDFLIRLNYNNELRDAYFEEKNIENVWVDYDLQKNKKASYLSKVLYYELIDLKEE